MTFPQPSPVLPQKMFCCAHDSGTQVPASGGAHAGHWITPPQPLPCGPHEPAGSCAHVSGVHTGGLTHDVRSKSMNSSSSSCGVIEDGAAPPGHSLGKVSPVKKLAFAWLSTWKSLYPTRPHVVAALNGVS